MTHLTFLDHSGSPYAAQDKKVKYGYGRTDERMNTGKVALLELLSQLKKLFCKSLILRYLSSAAFELFFGPYTIYHGR